MIAINVMIGIVGMFFILVGFVLEEFNKRYNQNTVKYNFINILGSGMLIYYAYSIDSWPFIILNTVWLIAALIKLIWIEEKSAVKTAKKKKR